MTAARSRARDARPLPSPAPGAQLALRGLTNGVPIRRNGGAGVGPGRVAVSSTDGGIDMTQATVGYALARTLDLSYEEVDARVRDELQKEGFGVLTEIDVKATLKKKLDVDFPK